MLTAEELLACCLSALTIITRRPTYVARFNYCRNLHATNASVTATIILFVSHLALRSLINNGTELNSMLLQRTTLLITNPEKHFMLRCDNLISSEHTDLFMCILYVSLRHPLQFGLFAVYIATHTVGLL